MVSHLKYLNDPHRWYDYFLDYRPYQRTLLQYIVEIRVD